MYLDYLTVIRRCWRVNTRDSVQPKRSSDPPARPVQQGGVCREEPSRRAATQRADAYLAMTRNDADYNYHARGKPPATLAA